MRFSTVAVLASTVFGVASAQKFQQVEVGMPNGTIGFNPSSVSDFKEGDVIQFIFYPKKHSVTQSTFAAPCTYNGGVNTGLIDYNGTAKPAMLQSWNFTLPSNATDKALWFFCSNPGHCETKGMVFSVNPDKGMTPNGPTSHAAFVAAAMKVPVPTNGTASANGTTTGSSAGANSTGAAGAGNSAQASGSGSGTAAAGASGTGAPASAPSNGAASVARNSAGALAAFGIALGLLL